MISNPERTTLISSMGWVDHDALWRFDVAAGVAGRVPLKTGARYASVHASGSHLFSVAHHFDGARFEVTVRSFSDPGHVLASATVTAAEKTLAGDASAWRGVPLLYVEFLGFAPWKDYVLLKISPLAARIDVQRLEWYDDSYDKLYQGVVDVLELPGEQSAVVSVQRSSTLVLHDLKTGNKTGTIVLGRRAGNPALQIRNDGDEIWASDYDTLLVLERSTWRIVRRARLQGAFSGTGLFIGDYAFAPDEPICVVARPFKGDVVGLDTATLRIRHVAKLGRQPLEVAALSERDVVARDWKSGDLLRGTLQRRRWF